ncbi:EscU/YscU/HrcU family type III secretion system export apparatus switch protein [Rhodovulum adriaticum]|uniref:Flagellar biosynthetic protein FlhB n=1 Tax=Rhodovulum adriaticum TaxID=35804 RepID=A0A4R2NZB3_RHOAD|nr:flagellar type III secretion system protein FlhB [Rhodovulum adriaticum]MBK1634772.1 flagellar biosynthesis protein FlhB [Rhodovulum adriaticum]TCP27653.1 flagellar biosynthetic protein FlhB [Rhodovulum adriaticum]
MSGASQEDAADKPHEPTQKKLDDARRKGEIAKSADLNTAASYAGLLLAALALGGTGLAALGTLGAGLLGRAEALAPLMLSGPALAGGLMLQVALGAAPFLLLPGMAVLASVVAQRSLVVAPARLRPKLSRLNPVANAAQKFGRSGLFDFAKSTAKLTLYAGLLGVYLAGHLDQILALPGLDPGPANAAALRMGLGFLSIVVVTAAVLGVIDLLWQRAEHGRRHRMSHQELKDEIKQSEGDPHMKQQRRQRATDIATNRMLADVPKADVVIVNPTHVAVALAWDRGAALPPICVAKGVDEIAARIREIAAEAGVPMRRDPPAARALHANVEIGQPILPEHYAAVAAAIRFAEEMRRRAGGWR